MRKEWEGKANGSFIYRLLGCRRIFRKRLFQFFFMLPTPERCYERRLLSAENGAGFSTICSSQLCRGMRVLIFQMNCVLERRICIQYFAIFVGYVFLISILRCCFIISSVLILSYY